MQCLKCGLRSTIDCQAFQPGETRCLRCGQEMNREQKRKWEEYWAPFLGRKKGRIARFFSPW